MTCLWHEEGVALWTRQSLCWGTFWLQQQTIRRLDWPCHWHEMWVDVHPSKVHSHMLHVNRIEHSIHVTSDPDPDSLHPLRRFRVRREGGMSGRGGCYYWRVEKSTSLVLLERTPALRSFTWMPLILTKFLHVSDLFTFLHGRPWRLFITARWSCEVIY